MDLNAETVYLFKLRKMKNLRKLKETFNWFNFRESLNICTKLIGKKCSLLNLCNTSVYKQITFFLLHIYFNTVFKIYMYYTHLQFFSKV